MRKVLGACGAALLCRRNLVGGAVMLVDNLGVLDRDVVGALIKIFGGIATLAHDRNDQDVGLAYSFTGRIDELSLQLIPRPAIAVAFRTVQRANIQRAVTFLSFLQVFLGGAATWRISYFPIILGTRSRYAAAQNVGDGNKAYRREQSTQQ